MRSDILLVDRGLGNARLQANPPLTADPWSGNLAKILQPSQGRVEIGLTSIRSYSARRP